MVEGVEAGLYEPREDSFLLQSAVQRYAWGKVLDMGTGTGFQAQEAARLQRVSSVLAVDKNPKAVAYCKSHIRHPKIRVLQSDLFSHVPSPLFDTIIFNPPYLPSSTSYPDIALDGGKHGYELILHFLREAGDYLQPGGQILLIISSLSGKDIIDRQLSLSLFLHEQAGSASFDHETIYCYRITKHPVRQRIEKRGVKELRWFARGKRGIILTGLWRNKKVAVKVQRQDINVATIAREATVLRRLNHHGIGPRVLFSGRAFGEFVVYSFVEGVFFLDYLASASPHDAFAVLKQVFLQMRTLDKLGLVKEEMHRPYKHIIVGDTERHCGKVTLLDFERCTKKPTSHKPHNVTQFCHCVLSRITTDVLKSKGIFIPRDALIQAAQAYKHEPTSGRFQDVLHCCGISRNNKKL